VARLLIRKKTIGVLSGSVALMSSMALAACGSSGPASAAGASAGTISIGLINSETGANGPLGPAILAGVEAGVEDVNASGGVVIHGKKYLFKLYWLDDRSDPEVSLSDVVSLIRDDKVAAVIGPLANGAPTVAPVAAEDGVINISAASAVESLMDTPKYPLLFSTSPDATYRASAVIAGIKHWFPNTKSLAVVSPSTTAAQTLIPPMEKAAAAAGISFKSYLFPATSTDISAIATNVVGFHPDVVWSQPDDETILSVIKQLTDAGLPSSVPVFSWGGDLSVYSGANGRAIITQSTLGVDLSGADKNPAVLKFISEVSAKMRALGAPLTNINFASLYYPAVLVLAKAMEAAQSTSDEKAIAKAMRDGASASVFGRKESWSSNGHFPYPILSVLSTKSGTRSTYVLGN
jgi:branched-chain amino acid transport system substrate-binding protein